MTFFGGLLGLVIYNDLANVLLSSIAICKNQMSCQSQSEGVLLTNHLDLYVRSILDTFVKSFIIIVGAELYMTTSECGWTLHLGTLQHMDTCSRWAVHGPIFFQKA